MKHARDVAAAGKNRSRGNALRRVLATPAALLVVAVIAPASAPSVKPPVKTLGSFPGVARAFAYDAGRFAWTDSAFVLHVRTVHTKAQTTIGYTDWYGEYRSPVAGRRLVLEQRRLLWLSTVGVMPDGLVDFVYTGTVGSTHARKLASTNVYLWLSNGDYPTATIVGDAAGLSYGIAGAEQSDPDGGPWELVGGVWSIVSGEPQQAADAPPAYLLARAAGRIAIVPAVLIERYSDWSYAAPGGTVEIRNATSGALISSFPTGTVRALALSKNIAAVLEDNWVNLYNVATGELLGSTSVPADTAGELEIEGSRIVFRTNHAIKLLNAATGRVSTLATTTPWRPSGVAIDGRTVAWAESKRIAPGEASRKTFKTRIRAITLAS